MEIDVTTITAAIAVMWSAFQQYQISKMCAACPLRIEATKPKVEEVKV